MKALTNWGGIFQSHNGLIGTIETWLGKPNTYLFQSHNGLIGTESGIPKQVDIL